MLSRLFSWTKTHKAATVLVVVVGFWLFRSVVSSLFGVSMVQLSLPQSSSYDSGYSGISDSVGISGSSSYGSLRSVTNPSIGSTSLAVPQQERKVVTDTNLSLLVKDVRATTKSLQAQAIAVGGFMVTSSLSAPEEATSGVLTVRVPTPTLDSFLDYTRQAAVRVVSENITGRDVTDQFKDIEARLTTLRSTKATFEGIMAQAKTVDEILRVQQSIFQIQDQIDALIGQRQYIENTSASASVTLFLSTDELSLPYAPTAPWRPEVVFKTAVRHLMLTLRGLGTAAIWLGVYAVLWVPILLISWFVKKRFLKAS